MSARIFMVVLITIAGCHNHLHSQEAQKQVEIKGQVEIIYPHTMEWQPAIQSPVVANDGSELICALTQDHRFALVPVTVKDWNSEVVNYFGANILAVDREDFPSLAKTGLHAENDLSRVKTINARTLDEINEQARPGRLSSSGFIAEDEDVISVLRGDDRLVRKLGLTHPQLAKPLLHLWNLILQEQKHAQGIWKGRAHAWVHFDHFIYNGKKLFYEVHFTKGGQKSPFQDGIEGAAHLSLWREMSASETEFLEDCYRSYSQEKLIELKHALSNLTSGEMEPFYIVRYGFYEGHTSWRTNPLTIAFIFGLRSIKEIEAAFPGKLDDAMNAHFTNGSALAKERSTR